MKTKVDVKTLVGLIRNRALLDNGSGKHIDQLLTDYIEPYVIQECDDPASFSNIGEELLKIEEIEKWPEVIMLAQLAILNGERRLKLTPERAEYLCWLIEELKIVILNLPDDANKLRCLELLGYHGSIYFGDRGYFERAAEMQLLSVKAAAGRNNLIGKVIAEFMETVYRLKQELFADGFSYKSSLFGILIERHLALTTALRGSSLEVQWAEGNAPTFMLEVCIWLNCRQPEWKSWIKTILLTAPKLGESWKLIGEFVRAVDQPQKDSRNDHLLETYTQTADTPERIATAYLVLIRHAISASDFERAKLLLAQMPREPSAKHVRVIAKRLLVPK